MIHLHKLYIKGFKDPDREIKLTFAEGAVTVIYGKNGCGKTTLLNVLNAVFRGDEFFFIKENISQLSLYFTISSAPNDVKKIHLSKNMQGTYIGKSAINSHYDKSGDWTLFSKEAKSSILFGVHRGVIVTAQQTQVLDIIEQADKAFSQSPLYTHIKNNALNSYANFIKKYIKNNQEEGFENIKDAHLSMDFITIKSIKNAILNSLREGKIQTIQKTANAFFEVIEAFEKQMSNNFDLIPDTEKRVKNQMNFIQNAISQQPNSSLKEKLEKYITTFDSTALDTKISRAVLLGVLDKAETLSPELYAVKELQTLFNAHLSYGKKLEVTDTEVFIDLGKGRRHELDELSSGERNLLTMLTLFLIIGSGRNFLMIDEPENSLHLDWQSDFIQLVEKMNPQAQIIVATHSPAIATNTKSLVELI